MMPDIHPSVRRDVGALLYRASFVLKFYFLAFVEGQPDQTQEQTALRLWEVEKAITFLLEASIEFDPDGSRGVVK